MKKYPSLLLLLAFAFAFSVATAQNWQYATQVGAPTPPASSNLASFTSDQVGFVAGEGENGQPHTLHKTLDGGNTWSALGLPDSTFLIRQIDFVSDQVGFLAGYKTTAFESFLYKTMDGGGSWIDISPDSAKVGNSSYEVVDFMDADRGFFANNGFIYKTMDGGQSWTFSRFWANFGLGAIFPMDISFSDIDHGTVACWDGTFIYNQILYSTSDGGNSWDIDTLGRMAGWEVHIQRPSPDQIYLMGGASSWQQGTKFYTSSNGGTSWDTLSIDFLVDSSRVGTSLQFMDVDTGYMLTDGSHILKTIDGGQNWTLDHQDTTWFNDIQVTANTVYAVGNDGVIVKKDLSTGIGEPGPLVEVKLFPNPSSDQFFLQLPATLKQVEVTVRDLQGRALLSQAYSNGAPISIETEKWPSGMYLVTLETDGWMHTRKAIKK